MNRGLTRVSKTVVRSDTGKPHTQGYWVKLSDVRAMAQAGNGMEAVRMLGGDMSIANDMIQSWVSTARYHANDLRGGLLNEEEMRRTLARMHNGPDADKIDMDRWTKTNSNAAAVRTARAIRLVSQMSVPREGIQVFRGIHGEQSQAILASIERGQALPAVAVDPMMSASSSRSVTEPFARSERDAPGVILSFRVPRSAVAFVPTAFQAAYRSDPDDWFQTNVYTMVQREREVVVHTTGVVRPDNVEVMR